MKNYLISDSDNLRSVAIIQTDDIIKSRELSKLIEEIIGTDDYEMEWITGIPGSNMKDPFLEVDFLIDGIKYNRQIGIKSLPLIIDHA